MKIIGLTGGIGSGKSTVSQMIRRAGIPVICADKYAREVVGPGRKAYKKIVKTFGKEILKKNKTINRLKLGSIVFQSPGKRKILNKIVHPEVLRQMKQETKGLKGKKPAIWDVPLLFEAGFDKMCGVIVLVDSPEKTRIKRLMKRDDLSQSEIKKRMASQMPMKKKRKKADYIIDNSGTIIKTKRQVEQLAKKLKIEYFYK